MGRTGQNPGFAVVVGVRGGGEGDGAVVVVADGDGVGPALLLYVGGLPAVNVECDAEGLGVVDYAKGVVDEGFDVYLRTWSGEVQSCGKDGVDALYG